MLIMEKVIVGYPDYTRAVIKGLTVDGLILCDMYGSRKIKQIDADGNEVEFDLPLFDENVSVENGRYFTLTDEDYASYRQ